MKRSWLALVLAVATASAAAGQERDWSAAARPLADLEEAWGGKFSNTETFRAPCT